MYKKYLKYKNKYLELKVLYGGSPTRYTLLGYYTTKLKGKGVREPKIYGSGDFTHYEREITVYHMCCESKEGKIEIILYDSQEDGDVRVFTYGHIKIKKVDAFKPLEYVPINPESFITLDIDRPFTDYKCMFFDFSSEGIGGDKHNGYVIIRNNLFKKYVAHVPEPEPTPVLEPVLEPVSTKYGFQYLHQQRTYTTFYSLENEKIIQNAIDKNERSVTVIHTTLKGVNTGNKVQHVINLLTNRVASQSRAEHTFIRPSTP